MCDMTDTLAPEIECSIIIPVRDEAENVQAVYEELTDVLQKMGRAYEIIFIDDGSRDDTVPRLLEIARHDPSCTVIEFARNFGQTAAMAAGFEAARGHIFVPMDGDLQNDPHDIPALVAMLDEPPGYDVVSGWRKNRHDKFLTRRVPSLLANRLIGWLTNTELHDLGCTLKAYRREALEDVNIYGEMHRFLPIIARWRGARLTEMVVNHRSRRHGTTKYDLRRTIKVMLDLVTVKFIGDYLTKPIYFFGKAGLLSLALSFTALVVALFQKFGYLTPSGAVHLNRNVLVLLAVMLSLMSVMFVMMGLISELLVRIYHESQGRRIYRIRRTTTGSPPDLVTSHVAK